MNPNPHKITWLGILALLILRLPLLVGLPWLLRGDLLWLEPVYQIGTYLLVALLIWWEREQLGLFHMDWLALALIVLFKPLSTAILAIWGMQQPLAFPSPLSFALWVIALALGVVLWKQRAGLPRFQAKSLGWFVIGALSGVAASLAVSLLMIGLKLAPLPGNPGPLALWAPLYQLGYAAIDEEPLFRGFLWGALRRLKWPEGWICLLQAALFSMGHLFLLGMPNGGFNLAIIFLGGLLGGVLAWRSRSIATSMAFHAFWNGSALFIYPILALVFK
jgi:membrane protease YdiL (CAAX protease family)